MFRRILAMLALFAVAVSTTAVPAHMAAMRFGTVHVHPVQMAMHVEADPVHGCAVQDACTEADIGDCALVCTGITAIAPIPGAETVRRLALSRFSLPADNDLSGRSPDLNERPPRSRLV